MSTAWKRWFSGQVSETWTLQVGQTANLKGRRREPVAIRVQRGLLLVTREGDFQDHILAAGDEVAFPVRGRIVAWALEPTDAAIQEARLDVHGAQPCPPLPARS